MFCVLKKLFTPRTMPTIQVFVRHCYYSAASAHKGRFPGFSREKCYHNLIRTMNGSVGMTFFLDTSHAEGEHFLKAQNHYPVVEFQAGCEAVSFLKMLDYAVKQDFHPDTIIYFLEDDYIHKPQWTKILQEGIDLPAVDYVTLFDHKDKYFPDYQNLKSTIFHSESCHWRTTPSTTNTYAMRFKTLKKHVEVHRHYSLDRKITADHDKFCALAQLGLAARFFYSRMGYPR